MALYRVIAGVIYHPGGIAGLGESIALDPADGDPLCGGDLPVLERVPELPLQPGLAPESALKSAKPRRARTDTP